MPKLDRAAVAAKLQELFNDASRQICDAVDDAPPGALLSGSEEVVCTVGHELSRSLFETVAQARIDAAEAAFPPSGRSENRSEKT